MLATPWISRLAAVLLLAAVALAAFLWVVEPLRASYANADATIAEARDLLLRYERIAALRPSLADRVAALGQDASSTDSYLSGETDALAAATLQSRVASLIASTGGGVSSIQVLPTREEAGLRRVTIRLQFSTTIQPLARILHELEAGKPVLFADNLDIQGRQSIEAAPANSGETEPSLAVSFDLYGFLPAVATGTQP